MSDFDAVLAGLREKFRANLQVRATELENHVASDNAAEIRGCVHRISGTAGSYGFAEISDAATRLDLAFKQGAVPSSSRDDLAALIALMRAA